MRIVDKFAKTRRVFFKLKPCKFASKVPKNQGKYQSCAYLHMERGQLQQRSYFYDIWLQINPFNLIKTQNQNFPVPS